MDTKGINKFNTYSVKANNLTEEIKRDDQIC